MELLNEFMQENECDARISVHGGTKWLTWDGISWIVYERKPYAKKTTASAYSDLEIALEFLASEAA